MLEVARELFYWHGIRATGVDHIANEAGVGPTTLYRLFSSKDDLVGAYVEREGRRHRQWFSEAVKAAGPDARDQILSVFDALETQVRPERCRGCPLQMALAELPDTDHPGHRHAVANKRWVRDRFGELARQLPATISAEDAEALADRLHLLMEGVYGSVQALGADGPARRARSLAQALVGDPD